MGALYPFRADPVVENVAPKSTGGDGLLGEAVGALSHYVTDPVLENPVPQSTEGHLLKGSEHVKPVGESGHR